MNAFRKLKVEYAAIVETIESYCEEPNITNSLENLNDGIQSGDYELITYCLDEIIEWYNSKIREIASDHYAMYRLPEHQRNLRILKEINSSLKPDDCDQSYSLSAGLLLNEFENTNTEFDNIDKTKLIFLSHRSTDKKYADALRDFVIGLGVKNEQLLYTSHPLHKIPMDENIYDYLRRNISSEIFMIILWSDAYLESPACMNEMGAAWVTQSDYTNIYVPDFSFGNPKYHECAVDTRKMGAVLNGDAHCKASLLELKNKIVSMFDLEDDEANSIYLIDEFIRKIIG